MKRKHANRPNWKRIIQKSYFGIKVNEESFNGYLAYLNLEEVKEELWVTYGSQRVCIVKDNYVWLQHLPEGSKYALTSTFNEKGEFVQGYFDIVKRIGTDETGIPYWDDLYLDIVILPNGEIYTLDEDELEQAKDERTIGIADYEYAKNAAEELIEELKEGRNYLLKTTELYYKFMKELQSMKYGTH
jgi:predicted RNA-binding protein associated with RNAse of E/G family